MSASENDTLFAAVREAIADEMVYNPTNQDSLAIAALNAVRTAGFRIVPASVMEEAADLIQKHTFGYDTQAYGSFERNLAARLRRLADDHNTQETP